MTPTVNLIYYIYDLYHDLYFLLYITYYRFRLLCQLARCTTRCRFTIGRSQSLRFH